ncbi:MAG: CDP-glucose 4,6-dehydratase [Pelagibacteraceae bacterium]
MIININKRFWKNKKVFVTGHTGFKGSWLCIMLNLLGAQVTGYSLKPKTKPNLFTLGKIGKIIKKSIIADVRDYNRLYQSIKKSKASIVIHMAAQPLVRHSFANPKETFDTNFIGSLNILESIRRIKNVKSAIIITTDKVYDVYGKEKIYKETDILGGLDPYSSSKVCVEHLCFSYIKCFFSNKLNQKIATVRAGNVIGGGDFSEDRLIPDIYRFAKKKKKIVIRNPLAVRPWQHVLEPLSGYLMLTEKLHTKKLKLLKPNWNFGPNISCCKSVKYIANYFSIPLGLKVKNEKLKKNTFKPETSILRLSNHKAKNFLKWKPRWSLNESLDKIIEWNRLIKKFSPLDVCKRQIISFQKKTN